MPLSPHARAMTRYRLPLELELHVLELALPPLRMTAVKGRVQFCLAVSLVHRSFTAWAQQHLREQFVYTYQHRHGQLRRLEKRRRDAEAAHDWKPKYVLLDLQWLDYALGLVDCRFCGMAFDYDELVTSDDERADERPRYNTNLADWTGDGLVRFNASFLSWLQGIPQLGLRLPHTMLDFDDIPGVELLELATDSCIEPWVDPVACPLGPGGTLILRYFNIDTWIPPNHAVRSLVLHSCDYLSSHDDDFSQALPNLVDFVSHLSVPSFSTATLSTLPSTLCRAFFISEEKFELQGSDGTPGPTFSKPANLELCSLVQLRPPSRSLPPSEIAGLETLCAPFVAAFVKEGADFRYKLSSRSAEEELADVMGMLAL
ncbi:hypothetical protein BMF94_1910 [Rhodotorula taiwanensis]|uniref:F-box domain-containing protein n=1 Tax=Rhodotorula taiwanensis TaxID=741276 RepID=A0A2S5BDT6_9BASI|nr:hypothetical protein BMF94_1910 [Rhodotorula taiwanensis]